MAVNGAEKTFPAVEFPLSISRQDAFPLDKNSLFYSMADAQEYAKTSPLAYVGQYISVVVDGLSTAFQIKDSDGSLEILGAGGMAVATDEEVKAMFTDVFDADASEVGE